MKTQLLISILFVMVMALVVAVGIHNSLGYMPSVDKVAICPGAVVELPIPVSRWWDVVVLPLVAFAILIHVVMTWRKLHMGDRDQMGNFSATAWITVCFGFLATFLISMDAGRNGLIVGATASMLANGIVVTVMALCCMYAERGLVKTTKMVVEHGLTVFAVGAALTLVGTGLGLSAYYGTPVAVCFMVAYVATVAVVRFAVIVPELARELFTGW